MDNAITFREYRSGWWARMKGATVLGPATPAEVADWLAQQGAAPAAVDVIDRPAVPLFVVAMAEAPAVQDDLHTSEHIDSETPAGGQPAALPEPGAICLHQLGPKVRVIGLPAVARPGAARLRCEVIDAGPTGLNRGRPYTFRADFLTPIG